MNHQENIEKLVNEFKNCTCPLSARNLRYRVNLPKRYVQWLLTNNKDVFMRAHPNEVGSGKYAPVDSDFGHNATSYSKSRKMINIWKLRQ